jgi:hypothetical protein
MGKGLLAGIVWQMEVIAGSLVAPMLGFEAPPLPPGAAQSRPAGR